MKDKTYKKGDFRREKERLDNRYLKLKIKDLRSRIGGGVIATILAILGFVTKNWLFFLLAGIVAMFFMAGTFPALTKLIFGKVKEIFSFLAENLRDFINTVFPPGADGGFWPNILSFFSFLNSFWFWFISVAIIIIVLIIFFNPVTLTIGLILFGIACIVFAIIGIVKAAKGKPFDLGFGGSSDSSDDGTAGSGAGNKGNDPPPNSKKGTGSKKPRRVFGRGKYVDYDRSGVSRGYEYPSSRGEPSNIHRSTGWSSSRWNPSNWFKPSSSGGTDPQTGSDTN